MMMLEVKNINTYYGNIHALKGVSLCVDEGEIVSLIGSNGAGKTTTLSSIIGLVHPRSGEISFLGQNITKKEPHEIMKCGISLVPEGREVFPNLTVRQNLMVGGYIHKDPKKVEESLAYVFDLFPRLQERLLQPAGTLSGGEQQMLAIGRALMNRPKLLMFDEPSLGLAPNLVKMIFGLIREIAKSGVTILLIEQNAKMALRIADRGYVLSTGYVTMSDKASALLASDEVRRAYLGR